MAVSPQAKAAFYCLLLVLIVGAPVALFLEPFHFLADLCVPNLASVTLPEPDGAGSYNNTRVGRPIFIHMPRRLWPDRGAAMSSGEEKVRLVYWLTLLFCVPACGCVLGTCILSFPCLSPGRWICSGERPYEGLEDIDVLLGRHQRKSLCTLAVVAHLLLVTKIVLHAAMTHRLSTSGIDFEACCLVMLYGTSWTVIQAVVLRFTRASDSVFPVMSFASAMAMMLTPLLTDPLDTFKDALFGGIACTSPNWLARLLGLVSLMYTWFLHLKLLGNDTLRLDLEEAYLSVLNLQPKKRAASSVPPAAEARAGKLQLVIGDEGTGPAPPELPEFAPEEAGCCRKSWKLAAWRRLLRLSSPDKRRALEMADGPQVIIALLFSLLHGFQPWVLVLNVAVPLVRYALTLGMYEAVLRLEEVRDWLAKEWVKSRGARTGGKALFYSRQLVASLRLISEQEALKKVSTFLRQYDRDDIELNRLADLANEVRSVQFRPDADDIAVMLCWLVEVWHTSSLTILGNTRVSQQVLAWALGQCLQGNSALEHLSLKDRCVSQELCSALAAALPSNHVLQSVDLSQNYCGDSSVLALARGLRGHCHLQQLHLAENCIGVNGALALADALRTNASLEELHLPCNEIGATGAAAIASSLRGNLSLLRLDLSGNGIGDDGADGLAEALHVNCKLARLDLQENFIGDRGAQALSEALRVNGILRWLDLSKNNVGVEGVRMLAQTLRSSGEKSCLFLFQPCIRGEKASPATNIALQHLDLSSNCVRDHGARALADALGSNCPLQELRLDEADIGTDGAKTLAHALRRNSALRKLDLSKNSIGLSGAQNLADALSSNATLQELHLEEANVGDGALALALALQKNGSLQKLHLQKVDVGDRGAQAFAEALRSNDVLQELHLEDAEIGAEGAQALALALQRNGALRKLHLSKNDIGDRGAQALAEALRSNRALQELYLQEIHVGADGTWDLALARDNGVLRELHLS